MLLALFVRLPCSLRASCPVSGLAPLTMEKIESKRHYPFLHEDDLYILQRLVVNHLLLGEFELARAHLLSLRSVSEDAAFSLLKQLQSPFKQWYAASVWSHLDSAGLLSSSRY